MNRTQFLAVLAIVAVVGILAFTRIQSGAESAAAADGSDSESGTGTESADGSEEDQQEAALNVEVEPDGDAETGSETTSQPQVEAPPILDPKPALVNIDGWINTDATSLDDFDGQVRVVEFWTFGCFNCKNRIPHTQELYAEYKDQGLEIIGIHAPEFDHERDPVAVEEATVRLGVDWPVALDTEKTNFRSWQTNRRFWPRVYVLDQNGDVRYDHIGEGDYDGLDEIVAYLIENGP